MLGELFYPINDDASGDGPVNGRLTVESIGLFFDMGGPLHVSGQPIGFLLCHMNGFLVNRLVSVSIALQKF